MKRVKAESWSVTTIPDGINPEEPYLKTGIDSKPEVHPRQEIQLNAAARLVATSKEKRKSKASIMPSNQAGDHDTHISSVSDLDIDEDEGN